MLKLFQFTLALLAAVGTFAFSIQAFADGSENDDDDAKLHSTHENSTHNYNSYSELHSELSEDELSFLLGSLIR